MTTEEYRNDMLYHAALSIGKAMLEKGIPVVSRTELLTLLEDLGS